MSTKIILPDMNAVTDFVNLSDTCDEKVLVSSEDGHLTFQGTSLMAMISLVGTKIIVYYPGESSKMECILKQYRCG